MRRKGVHPTLVPFLNTSARLHSVPAQLYESRKWRALIDLLANSWFERVWVVQEVVMAPAERSRAGCLEDPIILCFEKCTISFNVFTTVVQTIYDNHLHEELVYDHKSKDSTDQLGKYPPVRTSMSFFLPAQMLFRVNEGLVLGARIANVTTSKLSSPLSFEVF